MQTGPVIVLIFILWINIVIIVYYAAWLVKLVREDHARLEQHKREQNEEEE